MESPEIVKIPLDVQAQGPEDSFVLFCVGRYEWLGAPLSKRTILRTAKNSELGVKMRSYILNDIRITVQAQIPGRDQGNADFYRVYDSNDIWTPEVARQIWSLYARSKPGEYDKRLTCFGDTIVYYPYETLRRIIGREESDASIDPTVRFGDATANKKFILADAIRQFEFDAKKVTAEDELQNQLQAIYQHNAKVELAALKANRFGGGTNQFPGLNELYANMQRMFSAPGGELTELGTQVLEKLSPS